MCKCRLLSMKCRKLIPVTAVALLCITSCVGTKNIRIITEPKGASVSINGELQKEVTPANVKVEQKRDLGIVVSLPGYETASRTVYTRTNWWLSLLWTKTDPRARFIEEDEVYIPLKKIPTLQEYVPTTLPAYSKEHKKATTPPLRSMPKNL